jgi:hypothetical protein
LPPLEQEQPRQSWNVQRTLLLAGLVWISLGVCIFLTLSEVTQSQRNDHLSNEIPAGIQ